MRLTWCKNYTWNFIKIQLVCVACEISCITTILSIRLKLFFFLFLSLYIHSYTNKLAKNERKGKEKQESHSWVIYSWVAHTQLPIYIYISNGWAVFFLCALSKIEYQKHWISKKNLNHFRFAKNRKFYWIIFWIKDFQKIETA